MALTESTAHALQRAMAQTDLGSLILGLEQADHKAMVFEILRNQLAIMQVLAEMNGLPGNPKAGRDLI
jgi:hypothetical protein